MKTTVASLEARFAAYMVSTDARIASLAAAVQQLTDSMERMLDANDIRDALAAKPVVAAKADRKAQIAAYFASHPTAKSVSAQQLAAFAAQ